MEDDLTTASLQVLSFGQAGLHPVSERPSMRDRRSTDASTERSKTPSVNLRRSSLMNERTTLRRASRKDSKRTETTRSRHPLRKRKSDELSSIDLSELDDSSCFYNSREPEMLSPLTPPKNALENLGEVFVDMNARWQQAFQSEMGRPPRHLVEAETSFHPLSGSGIFTKPRDPPGKKDGVMITPITPATKTVPTPISASFLQLRNQSSSSNEGDSPCSVAALTRGCGACFWERSLAWSEDDDSDDDSIVHSRNIMRTGSITEHLSVPKHLGRKFAESTSAPLRSNRGGVPMRRPPMSRTITLESDSRHKLPGAKMFRQTDVDKVTEIHWEEKVLDTTAIDLMAKLSL